MNAYPYWRQQTPEKALFPEIEWNKPERRDQAGKLGIVGGNKLSFAAAAEAYQTAKSIGAGSVRVLFPDSLKRTVPPSITDIIYGVSAQSGSLGKESANELKTLADWADGILLIGDTGRNSETAVLYENFIDTCTGPLTITRDAIDLVKNAPQLLVEREETLIVASFAQLQKIFQAVYYPKVLTFSMQLMQLVEALHKFTTTYPCSIVTLHADTLLIASSGEVITQKWDNPMAIWRGDVAAKAACYWLWHQERVLESVTSSLVSHS